MRQLDDWVGGSAAGGSLGLQQGKNQVGTQFCRSKLGIYLLSPSGSAGLKPNTCEYGKGQGQQKTSWRPCVEVSYVQRHICTACITCICSTTCRMRIPFACTGTIIARYVILSSYASGLPCSALSTAHSLGVEFAVDACMLRKASLSCLADWVPQSPGQDEQQNVLHSPFRSRCSWLDPPGQTDQAHELPSCCLLCRAHSCKLRRAVTHAVKKSQRQAGSVQAAELKGLQAQA